MIYLIRLPYFLDETGTKFGTILKFGFTDDYRSRKNQYLGNNLSIIELKKIDGGTLEDEARLKIYFKQEGYVQCRNEWLYDNEKTINFFNTYDTIDKIRRFLDSMGIVYVKKNIKVQPIDYRIIYYVISKLGNTQEIWNEIIDLLKYVSPEDHKRTLCTKYNLSLIDLQNYIDSCQVSECPIFKAAQKFNELKDVTKKLKMLVDLSEDKEITEFCKFLDLIPTKYKDYYELLGIDRIKANNYREKDLKRELRVSISNSNITEDLEAEIFKTFETGKRYPKDEIKKTLKDIYSRMNYTQTAKSTDLNLYFYTKKVYLTNIKKAGLEIIAKK